MAVLDFSALAACALTMCIAAACGGASSESQAAKGETSARSEASPRSTQSPSQARHVSVNGAELDARGLDDVDRIARARVPDGDYWYDPRSGACGAKGGPTAAFMPAGLTLGGALRADASGGGSGMLTGVFVNDREIHVADYQALARLGQILPGRYWLDANGYWGIEGSEFPLGNLLQSASATGPGYNRSTPGGHLMSDGQSAGWFDPKTGASVLVGG